MLRTNSARHGVDDNVPVEFIIVSNSGPNSVLWIQVS